MESPIYEGDAMTNPKTIEIYYPVEPRPDGDLSNSLRELAASIAAGLDKNGFHVLLFLPKRKSDEDSAIHGFLINGRYRVTKAGDAEHLYDPEERSRQLIDESRREIVRAAKPRDRQKIIENLNRQPLPEINGVAYTPPQLCEEDFPKPLSPPTPDPYKSATCILLEIAMGRIKTSKGTRNTDPGAAEILRNSMDAWCAEVDNKHTEVDKTLSRSDNISFFESLRDACQRASDALKDDFGPLGNS